MKMRFVVDFKPKEPMTIKLDSLVDLLMDHHRSQGYSSKNFFLIWPINRNTNNSIYIYIYNTFWWVFLPFVYNNITNLNLKTEHLKINVNIKYMDKFISSCQLILAILKLSVDKDEPKKKKKHFQMSNIEKSSFIIHCNIFIIAADSIQTSFIYCCKFSSIYFLNAENEMKLRISKCEECKYIEHVCTQWAEVIAAVRHLNKYL